MAFYLPQHCLRRKQPHSMLFLVLACICVWFHLFFSNTLAQVFCLFLFHIFLGYVLSKRKSVSYHTELPTNTSNTKIVIHWFSQKKNPIHDPNKNKKNTELFYDGSHEHWREIHFSSLNQIKIKLSTKKKYEVIVKDGEKQIF